MENSISLWKWALCNFNAHIHVPPNLCHTKWIRSLLFIFNVLLESLAGTIRQEIKGIQIGKKKKTKITSAEWRSDKNYVWWTLCNLGVILPATSTLWNTFRRNRTRGEVTAQAKYISPSAWTRVQAFDSEEASWTFTQWLFLLLF